MSRSGLQEAISILDPLQTWNWDLIIPRIPGAADTRELTYKCTSTTIPGSSIEPVGMEAHGVKLNFAGRRVWSGTWNATFIESREGSTRDHFVKWMEMTRSWENNTGSYKSQYAVPIEITQYDDLPVAVRRIKLINAFPTAMGEPQLDQQSGIVTYEITFSYDYTQESSGSDN